MKQRERTKNWNWIGIAKIERHKGVSTTWFRRGSQTQPLRLRSIRRDNKRDVYKGKTNNKYQLYNRRNLKKNNVNASLGSSIEKMVIASKSQLTCTEPCNSVKLDKLNNCQRLNDESGRNISAKVIEWNKKKWKNGDPQKVVDYLKAIQKGYEKIRLK